MIKINVSRTCAEATQRERLTSGMQGVELSFSFSADWDDLVKTAVFEGSGRRIALTNIGDSCIIPHEVLAKHGGALRVGVYGRTADGSAATPTVYAQLGIIQRGADPNADPSTKPTLPVWAQIQAQIGDLSNLTTEDKTNLVAAINEAAKSGGGSGSGKDGTGIESITYKGEDEDGGNVYTVLLTDGSSYDITAPKGDKGDTGATGKDGAGMDITGATVGQIAKITAVDSDGKPTAWSPVDMPSGGTGADAMTKLGEWSVPDETSTVSFVQEYDLANLRKFTIILKIPSCSNASARWRAFIRFGASQKQYYLYNQSFSTTRKKIAVIELEAYGTKISYKCYVIDDYGEIVEFGFPNGSPANIGIIDNAKANPTIASAFGVDITASTTDTLAGMTAELWG